MIDIGLKDKPWIYWFVTIILSVLVVSIFVSSSTLEKKWILALMLGVIGGFSCFVLYSQLWKLLLILIVFVIPLRIDFYLIFKPSYFVNTHGVPGLPVSSFDILLIAFTCYVCFQGLRGELKIDFYPTISIPALIYLLLSGISAFYSADRSLSFAVLILMIRSFVAFLFFANRIKSRTDLLLVVLALTFGVLMQSMVGGLQYITGGSFLQGVFGVPETTFKMQTQGEFILSRVGGTVGHPNALAKYLCFCIPVFIAYFFARLDNYNLSPYIRKLALLTALMGGVTLLLTMSRGSWVAMGLTFMFLFYEICRRYFKSRLKAMVAVIVLNAFLAGSVLAVFEDVRIRLFEDDYNRAQARLPMAMVALNVIKDQPIKGVGLNNYTRVMHAYDHTRKWQTYAFPHPVHNSYLLIAAESGIPALVAFLWVIIAVYAKAWPALRQVDSPVGLMQVGWMGGLMTWLIAGMFDRDFAGTNVMLWFTMAAIAATSRILSTENESETIHATEGTGNRP